MVTHNYVSDQKKLFGALYTDEGSAYILIDSNVVNNSPEWLHIWTPSIHDEVVSNCFTNSNYSIVHGTNITLTNNQFVPPGNPWPAAAQQIINEAGPSWMAGNKP